MTDRKMQIPHRDQPAQRQTTYDEHRAFWGPELESAMIATAGSYNGLAEQAQHALSHTCAQDDLQRFWGSNFPEQASSKSYEDFLRTIVEPVPVLIPAAQRDFSRTCSFSFPLCEGEGWQSPRAAGSPGKAPVGPSGTKQVGQGRFNMQAAKRAYKRACRRAEVSAAGGTWYRGRWMTRSDLDSRYVSSAHIRHFSQAVARHSFGGSKIKHLSLLSWNAGGLATHTWDGLQNWLATQQIQICCIQETWWPLQSDWSNGCYHILHHGTGRSGGLMTMIHSKLASKECIRSGTLANGRVQHTRIYDPKGGLDIINVYQKVWSHATAEAVRAERRKVWDAIAECLDRIPARNQVVMVGDMNVQLPSTYGITGTSVTAHKYRDVRDEADLIAVLRQHGLQAINTFHDKRHRTYSHAGVFSQLDYVFAKGSQITGLSKQAHGLHDFPLIAASGEGSHVPIRAQIPKNWRIWKYGQGPSRGPNHKAAMSFLQQNPDILASHVHQALRQPLSNLADIDQALWDAQQAATSTVAVTADVSQRPWQDLDLRGVLRRAWDHLRQARVQRDKRLGSLFTAWRHAAQFLRLIKTTRKMCRRLRRQKLLAILNNLQHASHTQEMAGIFKIVDKIAPKRNRQRPQFRNSQGGILDISEEATANATFMQQLYSTAGPEPLPQAGVVNNPLSQQDILDNLRMIPTKKAGPAHMAFNMVYKAGAEILAPVLHNFRQDWWKGGRPYVPQAWKDAWMILLPKPGRQCKGPADMRPIGLSHPIGKAILRALR